MELTREMLSGLLSEHRAHEGAETATGWQVDYARRLLGRTLTGTELEELRTTRIDWFDFLEKGVR